MDKKLNDPILDIDALTSIEFENSNRIPMDIIVNNFSMKQEIFNILSSKVGEKIAEELAEEIKEMFAIKMRLKQFGD